MRYLSVLVLLIGLKASASTVLISDIDDTVRQTNVRNIQSGTVLASSEFAGMAVLYQQLLKSISEVDYVTGGPRQLKSTVQFFLFWNDFPKGRIFPRDPNQDTVTHKVLAIEGIVHEVHPDALILIGDNGEKDPITYARINDEFKGIAQTFIHQIYADEVRADQNAWLTSIDLSVTLFAKGLISSEGLDAVLDNTIPKLFGSAAEVEQVLPAWGECKTFFKNFSRPTVLLSTSQEMKMQKYDAFLKQHCS